MKGEEAIVIFTVPACPHCRTAKAWLSEKGIRFSEYNVSADTVALSRLVWLTGRASVPAILVRGEMMVGFDPEELEQMLERAENPPQDPREPALF